MNSFIEGWTLAKQAALSSGLSLDACRKLQAGFEKFEAEDDRLTGWTETPSASASVSTSVSAPAAAPTARGIEEKFAELYGSKGFSLIIGGDI